MTPIKLLKFAEKELRKFPQQFAIAGGLAASYYRKQPRLTNDIDIILNTGSVEKSKESALEIIKNLGYDSAFGWITFAEKKLKNPVAIVIGRKSKNELDASIDFLLPAFSWAEQAVLRAQNNQIDFGFAKIPTISIEDVIIAKTFALQIEPNRYKDLDDLQSILEAKRNLDLCYIVGEFERHQITLPTSLKKIAPKAMRRI